MTINVDLGSRRELFVDRYLIERLDGAELRLAQPLSGGVALAFEKPWEGAFCGYCTILQDGGTVRLYYRGWPGGDPTTQVACLAESDDGITFTRPNLGLYEVAGTRENNVLLTTDPDAFDLQVQESVFAHNFAPLLDARPGVPPDQRYKALAHGNVVDNNGHKAAGLFAFASADGVRWRMLTDQPIITKGLFDSQNLAFWSEAEGCYVCYLRVVGRIGCDLGETIGWRDGVRSIARATSDDFLNWSEPVEMDMGETTPEHLYTNQTQPYFRAPHLYIALPGRFFPGRKILTDAEGEAFGIHSHKDVGYWHDCSDAVLLTSRGGNTYDRTFMEAFVRPGLDRRNWSSRCNYPACGLIQTAPEEMSFYIERHNAQDKKFLERMTLRLDGFASLHAGYAGGQMLSRPIAFAGRQLEINYSTSAGGSLRIAIEDEHAVALEGFSFDECDGIIGDEIRRTVSWQGREDLSALAGRPIRLRIQLRDADLYALQFTPGTS